jgi:glycosyltransferase involved in cell wall biosynthesis
MPGKLLVQGWRFIHHSYALVAQAHCLSLRRHKDITLRFEDLPFPSAAWQPSRGIFFPEDEEAIAALQPPEAGFVPDVTLQFKGDFSPPPSGRKFTFDTPEVRALTPEARRGFRSGAEVPESVHVLTPSHWTAQGYLRFGIPAERVHVVPHGVDPRLLRPQEEWRRRARREFGLARAFVIMSVGAMSGNKGIDLLLRAFARVAAGAPDARLVLKGADDLYRSRQLLREILDALPAAERAVVAPRLAYVGERFSARQMAAFLHAADLYVAPYLAEGFNLPVLEAAACGVPVICTGGGSTDDFTEASFAWRIRSQPIPMRTQWGGMGDGLLPDLDHLTELLRSALAQREQLRAMGAAGAAWIAQRFTWDAVTDRLVRELFPEAQPGGELGSRPSPG